MTDRFHGPGGGGDCHIHAYLRCCRRHYKPENKNEKSNTTNWGLSAEAEELWQWGGIPENAETKKAMLMTSIASNSTG